LAWATVVIPTAKKISPSDPRIAYIDLFAGPGRYEDGSKSTPVKVLANKRKPRTLSVYKDE
jgi:hypothetical protein